MKRTPLLLLTVALFCFPSIVFSQEIDDVKPSITFIYLPNSKGDLVPNGTGFFIGVDDTVRRLSFAYIVTAKHVLWDTATHSFFPNGWLRLNRKGEEPTFVRMPMRTTGPTKNVFVHPDTTVDLVVVRGLPDHDKFDFDVLPSQLIRTASDLKNLGLGEGTDIIFPALFLAHIGKHQNYPIIRFGKLALASGSERIRWGDQMQRLHLIESISIGGHSGAPVFAWFEPRMTPGSVLTYNQKRLRLIGVMQGYFGQTIPIGFRQTSIIPVYESHTGISAVVPVDLLQEILFSPELIEIRARE